MMSARSCASSISTRKPSSFDRRESEKLNDDGIVVFLPLKIASLCCGRWRPALGIVFPGDQQPAQQLSNRGFRDRIDEDKSSRTLEVRKSRLPAERFEIGFADIRAALDERGDDLSPSLIGETDDRDLRPRGVQRQTPFD